MNEKSIEILRASFYNVRREMDEAYLFFMDESQNARCAARLGYDTEEADTRAQRAWAHYKYLQGEFHGLKAALSILGVEA